MAYLKMVMLQYLVTVGWAIAGAISMGIGLGVALKVFTAMTPKLDEMAELRKGNLAVAIVLAAVIIAAGAVVAIAIVPTSQQ